MTDEAIVADEPKELDEVEETETDDSDEEYVDVNALQVELAKAKADKEKWEARYKSTKKQEVKAKLQETKVETKEVDLDGIVERKIEAMQEQKDFITKYGKETFDEVKKIKDQHPTLSLENAYRISPIAIDPANNQDPSSMSMGGRANSNAILNNKTIKHSDYVKLPQALFHQMKDKIARGEVIKTND